MRVLVLALPRTTPPLERFPEMVQALAGWRQRHRDKMEVFGIFPGGGGCAIVNVPDEATLQQMTLDNPFSPFQDIQVRPLVDGDTGIQQLQAWVQQLAGGR